MGKAGEKVSPKREKQAGGKNNENNRRRRILGSLLSIGRLVGWLVLLATGSRYPQVCKQACNTASYIVSPIELKS